MWPDREVAEALVRQVDGDRRRQVALLPAALEALADGLGMGHVAVERLYDGGLELGGAVSVEETDQGGRDGAEVVAAIPGCDEEVAGCVFRAKPITDSGPNRSLIPGQTDH